MKAIVAWGHETMGYEQTADGTDVVCQPALLTVACCTITRVHAGARYDLYVLTMSITACTVLTVSERLRKAGHAKQSGVPRSLALPLAHPMLGSVRAGPKQTKAS